MVNRLLDWECNGEANHKIQIVSCASAQLLLIIELVYTLRNILRFFDVGGIQDLRPL